MWTAKTQVKLALPRSMAKRSRDASFSPDPAETLSLSNTSVNAICEETCLRPGKITALDTTSPPRGRMQCSLPPHRDVPTFATIDEYEVHYTREHSNRCSSCGRNFPTAHFLSLHIDEHHNPLREAAQAQGEKTYACFVQDCGRKCSTPQKRRLHLIDKHMFPKVYNFRIVDVGIDKSTSMLKEGQRRRVSVSSEQKNPPSSRRRASTGLSSTEHVRNVADQRQSGVKEDARPESTAMSGNGLGTSRRLAKSTGTTTTPSDVSIDDLESSMSALRFVPPSVLLRQEKKRANR